MRRLVPLLFLALCACPPARPQPTTLQGDGFEVRVGPSPEPWRIVTADGRTVLTAASGPRFTFDEHIYEAQIIPGWDGYRSKERPWEEVTAFTVTASSANGATLAYAGDGFEVTVELSLEGRRVHYRQSVSSERRRFNKSALRFEGAGPFFGMGQRTASVDHTGLALYSWAEEGGLGGGENAKRNATNPYPNGPSMTYFPVPFFHTTQGVSVLVDTTRRSEVHFGSDADAPGTFRAAVDHSELALVLFVRDRPLDAIDDYTALTGRPPIPADWAWGPRRRVNRETLINGVPEYKLMRDRKLPLTAVDDAMHALPQYSQRGNEAVYSAWTAELHAHGYKALDYNNPYVSASSPNAAEDYAYGADAGFFEKAPSGAPATTFFISGGAQTISAVDLTNPAAAVWFQTLLKRSVDLGYDGWMHDFGEYVARDSTFFDGRTGEELHNLFPVLSAKAAYESALENGKVVRHPFTRSGYTGSQQWVLETWGGDPEASFDDTIGLPGLLRGGLNLGMVGVPYWSTDIGGFKCITDAPHDKEMLVRWFQMGALSPMMHDEDACSNPISGSRTKATIWDDQESQDLWRNAAGLHTRLAPYFRALAQGAHARGTPITQHPFLRYPQEPEAWKVEDSFFIGDALYGAPVVRRGLTTRSVWLPPGRYLEWTERTIHSGPATVTVPAPLDRLPLFVVENQLVPLLDAEVQTLAEATLPGIATEQAYAGVMDVVALLGPSGVATLTLADGTTLRAERLAEAGNPGALSPITDFSLCDRCGASDQSGAARRTRIASSSASEQLGEVRVTVSGGPARRVRWEVLLLE